MKRIVQLDLDLKYRTNIRDLFQQFRHFPPEAVIGIVREMQPVYRCGCVSPGSALDGTRVIRSRIYTFVS
ncbi:xyloside xylosyltransferase 1 [Tachysurus ichikawai]